MNLEFKLRSGVHAGKTLGWLQQHQPSYLAWIKEKRPEMLKEFKAPVVKAPEPRKEVVFENKPPEAMTPNMNFWNEGPSELSKPYLKKMQELGN